MKNVSKSKDKNKKKNKKKKINSLGFTLIELLATIAILSVVISIVVYFAMEVVNNAKNKGYQVTISNIEQEVSNYVLEEFNKVKWVSPSGENYQYQCVTVQDLIDAGYFKGDVLNSKVSEDRNVLATDRVYLERDKQSKTITKNILLVNGYEAYDALCSDIPIVIDGRIEVGYNPKNEWSKKKDISIRYTLDNYDSNYTYEYEFVADNDSSENIISGSKKFDENTTEKNVSFSVNDNGQLITKIKNQDGDTIANKTDRIDKIDNDAPTALISSTNNVASKQTAILTMSDNESGIAKYYFGQSSSPSNNQFIDGENQKSITVDSNVDKSGKWYLKVIDAVGNETEKNVTFYKTSLTVDNGSVNPNAVLTMAGNSFPVPTPTVNSGYTFIGWLDSSFESVGISYEPTQDDTLTGYTYLNRVPVEDTILPAISFNPNGSKWVKSISSTITATDSDGISTLKYIVSKNENDNAKNGNDISSGQSYTFSDVTDEYYIHAYACDGNNNCTSKSSNVFQIDNTKPFISFSSTNNVSSGQTLKATISDLHSGLGSYSWGNGNTSLGGVSEDNVSKTIVSEGTYSLTVTDLVGNIYSSSATFYKTYLNAGSHGSVTPSEVLTMAGYGFFLPTVTTLNNYEFVNWNTKADGSGVSYNAGTYYTVTGTTTLYAIVKYNPVVNPEPPIIIPPTPSDTTKPVITFSPDGTNGVWKKSESSMITVTDSGGSGIDSSSLKYVFSTSSSETPTTSFISGGTVSAPSNVTGTYYLRAIACDNAGNCTTATSSGFKLDNTKPTVSISATNNVASSQTVSLSMGDGNSGLASYSWGGSLSQTTTNLSGNPNSKNITDIINDRDSFVLKATDAVGNVSDKVIIKFHKTTLSVNNGSVSPGYVITKDGNSFPVPTPTANSGYKFVGWYNNSSFTGSPITIYTPTSSTTLYAKMIKDTPSDTTKPTITFNPDGTNGVWKKSESSMITVTDSGGSGINSSSLKYIFSKLSSETPTTSFTSGGTVNTPLDTGTYYLRATACDNAGNCTTATSKEFKLDNSAPTLSISNPYNYSSWYNKAEKDAGKQYKLTLTATDVGSGVDYYAHNDSTTGGSYSKYSGCSGNTCVTSPWTKEMNQERVTLKVCDKVENCTTSITAIYLDVTPPVVNCNSSGAWVQQTINSNATCSSGYESYRGTTISLGLTKNNSCEATYYMINCQGSLNHNGNICSPIFTASDNFGTVTQKGCSFSNLSDISGSSFSAVNGCNCIRGFCQTKITYTVEDKAGNRSSETFKYNLRYQDYATFTCK